VGSRATVNDCTHCTSWKYLLSFGTSLAGHVLYYGFLGNGLVYCAVFMRCLRRNESLHQKALYMYIRELAENCRSIAYNQCACDNCSVVYLWISDCIRGQELLWMIVHTAYYENSFSAKFFAVLIWCLRRNDSLHQKSVWGEMTHIIFFFNIRVGWKIDIYIYEMYSAYNVVHTGLYFFRLNSSSIIIVSRW